MANKNMLTFLLLGVMLTVAGATPKTIPFRVIRGLILIQTKVNGTPGNFVLDSGIPYPVLNSSYFKDGKASGIDCGGFQAINGSTESCRSEFVQIQLDEVSLSAFALVVDLKSVEKGKGLNIHGLLSLQVFDDYEVMIDYAANEIRLYDLDHKGNRLEEDPLPIPTARMDFRYRRHLPYIIAHLRGRELHLGIDTGVELVILSPDILQNDQDCGIDLEQRSIMGLSGETKQVPAGWLEHLTVNSLELPALKTLFLSVDPLNRLPGTDLDGLLGLEFLMYFRVAFNLKKKEICLWQRTAEQQEEIALALRRN